MSSPSPVQPLHQPGRQSSAWDAAKAETGTTISGDSSALSPASDRFFATRLTPPTTLASGNIRSATSSRASQPRTATAL